MRTIIICFLFSLLTFAQEKGVVNIDFAQNADGSYIISYDLNEDADKTFEVSLFLCSDEDSHFRLKLNMVAGDVGVGKFAGKNRKIKWITQEFAGDLQSAPYHFEVIAVGKSGIPWYYYVGSAVVAAGGAAAILVGGKKESASSKTEIIDPPSRP